MKSIILCADDYGQSYPISQAIIQLLQQKRLTATSCLTTSPYWSEHAAWLKSNNITADIGLHFNLTEGKPLSIEMQKWMGGQFLDLKKLMINVFSKKIPEKAILAEVNCQIDAFSGQLDYLPQFLDGHQHVHHLPVIREVVLKVITQRLPRAYVRSVYQPDALISLNQPGYIKKAIIQLSGGFAFKKHLIANKIPHNSSFFGIYDFQNAENYGTIFDNFLQNVSNNGLIMCHPGLAPQGDEDVIYKAREKEFQFLQSQAFLDLCKKHQVVLKRFNE